MKTILSFLCTVTLLSLSAGTAQAGGAYHNPVQTVSHCIYKTHTCEVNRCRYKKTAHDPCGRCYAYWITVVTYRDSYSNGTSRTYKVTYNG
ncbi:MAG: hypothetical protein DVB23_002249 [Verrucomicrobia bacterium]|nr:MAG: hypothetical protein DVB23_002249 [Verrucomicrobiota bacterium]